MDAGLGVSRIHRIGWKRVRPAGAVGLSLVKTVKLPGAGGWDYLAVDPQSRRLVVHEDSPDKYTVVENVRTAKGARTMEVDPKTHNIYLVTAKLVPSKPYSKPAPGTVQLLIFAK